MKLTHPASGQVIDVRADARALYESQGWTPVKSDRQHHKKASAEPVADTKQEDQ